MDLNPTEKKRRGYLAFFKDGVADGLLSGIIDDKKRSSAYYKQGYEEVEAKAGMHAGTFKVFVNFIPVADITYLVPEIYNKLFKIYKKNVLWWNCY